MNLKTTIALALLVVAGGAAWFLLSFGPAEKPSDTLTVLEKELKPDRLTLIEIKRGDRQVVLARTAGGEWSLPGKWPVRQPEVKQLVDTLTSLRSRFEPIPLGTAPDLKPYGLDRDPLVVQVKAGGQDYKLTFGEKADETNHFSKPTYLRLDAKPEVVRLAPNLVGALDPDQRPQDYYQQRRLFPAERVAKEGSPHEKFERLVAKEVAVTSGDSGYSLTKTASGWRLRDLVRDGAKFKPGDIDDRPDPEKLKKIEAALPDVWAERFVAPGEKTMKEMGLEKPEQTVQVTRAGGDTLELLVGAVSRVQPRRVVKPAPPFGGPPMKPQETVVFEEYRYARLKKNPQVFEVRGGRLKEVAVAATDLRDPQLARFRPEDARRVEVDEGGRQLVFAYDKDKQRWRLTQPSAFDTEPGKVTELLDKLAGLEARDKDIVDKDDPKAQGLEKPAAVKVALEEKDGDKGTKKRELTFLLGKETDKDRLYVKVAGEKRVNKVDDAVLKLVRRSALVYRNRRLLDVPTTEVAKVEVKRTTDPLTLEQVKGAWKLTVPVQADADAGKAEQLAGEAARLEAAEFVAESPSPEDLDKLYGLVKPDVTVLLAFSDAKKPARTLTLGKQRAGKQEYFARLDGDPTVFAVKKDVRDVLERGSLAYRRLQVWQLPPGDIAEVRVLKDGTEYRLQGDGPDWKVSGPFDATLALPLVRPMTDALADLRAEKYVAHTTKEPEKYGLDKPYLRVTVSEKAPKEDKKEPKVEKAEKEKKQTDHVLLIGGKADKDGRYAKLGDGDAVFVLPEKVVAAVDHSALDLLDRKLLALDEGRIQRVRTTHADGKSFTLERQKDAWRVVQAPPASFAPEADALDDSLRVWSNLRAARFAAYGQKVDPAAFGLEKPAVTVEVTLQEPGEKDKPGKTTTHTLVLGKTVDGGKGERYARLDKGPGVVVLGQPDVRDLDRTHLDFVSRQVLKFAPDKITAIKRVAGEDTVEIVKKDDNWRLLKPTDAAADGPTMKALTEVFADLRAVRVAAYPAADLGKFGLAKPVAVFTVTVSDPAGKPTTHVLNVGGPADDKDNPKAGLRYARVDRSDTVVVVRTRLGAVNLSAPALQFRDHNLARVDAPDRVVLERDGRKLTFARVDDTWKLTEPVDAAAESGELEAFVKELTRLRADELIANRAIDLKTYGLERPRARWRLLAGDKELLTLLVGAAAKDQDNKDGPRAYAKLGTGELIFRLSPGQSDKALAEYRSRKPWTALDAVQIDRLTFGYPKDAFTLQKVGGDWEFVGKPGVKANAEAVRDVVDALASLEAQRYVADRGGDLKLYGLEPPALALEIQTPTGKRTLKIGRQEGESARRYAAVPEQGGAVFILSEGLARRVVRPLQAFTATP